MCALAGLVAGVYRDTEPVVHRALENASHVYVTEREGRLCAVLFANLEDPLGCGGSTYIGLLLRSAETGTSRDVDRVIRAMVEDARTAEREAGIPAWTVMCTASATPARLFRHHFTDVSPRVDGSLAADAEAVLRGLPASWAAGGGGSCVVRGRAASYYRAAAYTSRAAVELVESEPWLRGTGFSEAAGDRVVFLGRLRPC